MDEKPHSTEISFRIEYALGKLLLHETELASQWRKCVVMWGSLHPAAVGCMLALARVAWGTPGLYIQHRGGVSRSVDPWLAVGPENKHGKLNITGRTDAEALALVIEAAAQ